jgi:hypothetical protein
MSKADCPALIECESDLDLVELQLNVLRDQADPAMTDRYGVSLPSPAIRIAELEDTKLELVTHIAYLRGKFCYA